LRISMSISPINKFIILIDNMYFSPKSHICLISSSQKQNKFGFGSINLLWYDRVEWY
jgi:hypothetical protein